MLTVLEAFISNSIVCMKVHWTTYAKGHQKQNVFRSHVTAPCTLFKTIQLQVTVLLYMMFSSLHL